MDSPPIDTSSEFTAEGGGDRGAAIDLKKGETKHHEESHKVTGCKQVRAEADALNGAESNSARSPKKNFGMISRFIVPATFNTEIQKKPSPEYLARLLEEKRGLTALPNSFDFKHLTRLVEEEILKVRTALGEMPTQEQTPRFVDGRVGRVQACGDASTPKVDRRVLLQEKVFVPVHEYPDYNFVGRILGPRGMTAKQLEEETGCRIMIRGRGSTRDEAADVQKSASGCPKEELHVLIQCEDFESVARRKLKYAVDYIRVMLKPPPDGEDELKRQQLMQLAIINGTYRPMNTLKMTLQNQNTPSPLSLCGLSTSASKNATFAMTTPNNGAFGNGTNNESHNMRMPFNNSARANSTPTGCTPTFRIGSSSLVGNDATNHFVKTNNTAAMMTPMCGGTQPSPLMSSSVFSPQLMDQTTISNMWNPQLASALLNTLANSPSILAKEYYKQIVASLNLYTTMTNGGLGTGVTSGTAVTSSMQERPINMQGYLTAAAMLDGAPCPTSGPGNMLKRPR
uniref:Female germline-specific tumor suppressor gld-1 n=1 Tax=Ascaris suum TaxID=6253 RepID=F1KTU4_ASCSU